MVLFKRDSIRLILSFLCLGTLPVPVFKQSLYQAAFHPKGQGQPEAVGGGKGLPIGVSIQARPRKKAKTVLLLRY